MNPTDAVTKDNIVPFSAWTHVNKTGSSDTSVGAGVGINGGKKACLGMSCLFHCLFALIS